MLDQSDSAFHTAACAQNRFFAPSEEKDSDPSSASVEYTKHASMQTTLRPRQSQLVAAAFRACALDASSPPSLDGLYRACARLAGTLTDRLARLARAMDVENGIRSAAVSVALAVLSDSGAPADRNRDVLYSEWLRCHDPHDDAARVFFADDGFAAWLIDCWRDLD